MGKLSNFLGFFVCRSSNSKKKVQEEINPSTNESTMSRPWSVRESAAVLQTAGNPPSNPSSNTSLRSIRVEPRSMPVTQNFKSPRATSLIRINTAIQKEKIEVADFKPEQRTAKKRMKYTCPICFRYFSEMLKADCCGNYICLYCAQDMNECIKAQKMEKVVCSFCKKENFTVSDVKPEDKLRRYTDSPYSSASNTKESFGMKNRRKFLDLVNNNSNKLYSATFSGFRGVRLDDADSEEPDDKYEAIKSASCGFNEIKKKARDSRYSQYSDRMEENVDDEECERAPRKLFSTFDASNVLNRPQSYSFELGGRHGVAENDNLPQNRNVSEIPTVRGRSNNRQRSPTRVTGSVTILGRLDDRSAIQRSPISESLLSIQSGLRG